MYLRVQKPPLRECTQHVADTDSCVYLHVQYGCPCRYNKGDFYPADLGKVWIKDVFSGVIEGVRSYSFETLVRPKDARIFRLISVDQGKPEPGERGTMSPILP